jgi:hypothetical protein
MALRLGVQLEKGLTQGIYVPKINSKNKAIKCKRAERDLCYLERKWKQRDPEGISVLSNKKERGITKWNIMAELQGLQ